MTIGLTFPRTPRLNCFGFSIAWVLVLCAMAMPSICSGEEQLTAGSSSKQFRKHTAQSLPYQQLNAQIRDKITNVVDKPSIYRRLPVTSIQADPDHFKFLVRYPEVIVNIWQLMGVTKMETERTGPYSIKTNDGAGTISSLELVYGTDKLHIFYGTGTYEGPVLRRKLTGECVLVLRTENTMGRDGKPVQTNQLDVFLKVKNATAGLIAKTIQPLVGSTADHNFVESLKFVQRLNETTSKNGPGVSQMSEKLQIDDGVRQKYKKVVDLVFQRAINRATPNAQPSAQPRQPVNPNTMRNLPARPTTTRSALSNPTYNKLGDSQRGVSGAQAASTGQSSAQLPARGRYAPAYPTPGVSQAMAYQRMSDGNVPKRSVLQTGAQSQPLQQVGPAALQIPPYDPQYSPRYQLNPKQQPQAIQPRYPNGQSYPPRGAQYTQPTQGWRGK